MKALTKILLLAAASTLALAGVAAAADRGPPPPVKAVVAVVPFSWTGFYVGLNAGGAFDNSTTAYIGGPTMLNVLADPGHPVPGSQDIKKSGFTGGVGGGYNWQVGTLVAGVEGDVNYMHIGDSSTAVGTNTATIVRVGGGTMGFPRDWTSTASASANWIATLRGRFGVAADRLLVFGTGGLALTDYSISGSLRRSSANVVFCPFVTCDAWAGSAKFNAPGWTIGGGAEFAVTDHVTIKTEALYYDFGKKTYDLGQSLVATPGASDFQVTKNARVDGLLARIGANYKF